MRTSYNVIRESTLTDYILSRRLVRSMEALSPASLISKESPSLIRSTKLATAKLPRFVCFKRRWPSKGWESHLQTGSGTWIKHFRTVNGFRDAPLLPKVSQRMEGKFGIKSVHFLTQRIQEFYSDPNTLSFSFVRHPFHRLAAAFDDRVGAHHDPVDEPFARAIGSNFSRFVDFVLTHAAYKKCSPLSCNIDRDWRPMHTR